MPSKEKIEGMFDSIAKDYDSLNHIMSLSIDKIWRRKAIKKIKDAGEAPRVLDVACGTGDFSIAIAKALGKGNVIGVDISKEMLEVMRGKVLKNKLEDVVKQEVGDGEDLRFEDSSFDRVVNAFGIRNFENREKGLKEALRVLKPGGRLVILELSRPENKIIRWFYDLYFLRILPIIGGKVSGDKDELRRAGFVNVAHKAFTLGICRMYCGEKR